MAKPSKTEAFYGITAALRESKNPAKSTENIFDAHIQKGAIFLESSYTHLYGWLGEVGTPQTLDDCVVAVPNVFDTAVGIEVLRDAGVHVSKDIIDHAINWFFRSQSKPDQTWSYFIPEVKLLPNDSDTTSNIITCLYELDAISKEEAVRLANNLVQMMCIHEDDGLPDVYIYKGANKGPWKEWKVVKRVDVVMICNTLRCLAVLEMDELLNGPIFAPFFQLLDNEVRKLLKGEESTYCKNYDGLDVVLFFLSRVVATSKKGKDLFGDEVGKLVKNQFGKDKAAMSIGCRILAAMNLDLELEEGMIQEAWELVGMQNEVDNSWPSYAYYNAHKRIYFGSKAVTTSFVIAGLKKLSTKLNV